MNLRGFKKDVEYLIGDFVDDCILFVTLNPSKANDALTEVLSEAVDLYNDMKDLIKWIGTMRNRGFGKIKISVIEEGK